MPNPDTEEWRIAASLDYIHKKQWEDAECPQCGGTGKTGGGFGSLSDPEECNRCWGTRLISKQVFPKEPKPKLPQDLIDHMRKAYLEYKLK